MLTSPLLICVIAFGQTGQPFKELSCRDEIASLETRLHQKITIKRELASHFLVVREDPADPMQELNAVATALRATVSTSADGFAIARVPKEMEAARSAYAASRAVWIQKEIDLERQFRKAYEADKNPAEAVKAGIDLALHADERFGQGDRAAFSQMGLPQLLPASKMAIELLDRIGAQRLGAIPVGKQAVYESRPIGNANQLPDATDLLQEYTNRQAELKSVKLPPDPPMTLRNIFTEIESDSQPPTDIRIVIASQKSWLTAFLETFDRTGRLVGRGFFASTAYFGPITSADYFAANPSPNSEKVSIPEVVLQRSADAAGVPNWILHPTKIEPLTLMAAFGMEASISADRNVCLVADLDDDLFSEAKVCVADGKLNVESFRSVLSHLNPYEKVEGADFTAWRPKNPDEKAPLDRKALEVFGKETWESGAIDWRQFGVLRQIYSPLPGVWQGELNKRIPELRSPSMWQTYRPPPEVIGAISDGDWEMLKSGHTSTAGQLGIVERLNEFFNTAVSLPPGLNKLPELFRHPAELYRETAFEATPIGMTHSSTAVYREVDHKEKLPRNWYPQAGGVDGVLADAKLVDGLPAMAETRDQCEARWDKQLAFQTGIRTTLGFTIVLPTGIHLDFDLPTPPTNISNEMHYSDLPQSLRDTTWKNVCQGAVSRLLVKKHG